MPIPATAVSDDDFLYRRINLKGQLNPDRTVNSNAYKKGGKPDPEISVDLATLSTIQESLLRAPDPTSFTIGIIQTRTVRALWNDRLTMVTLRINASVVTAIMIFEV